MPEWQIEAADYLKRLDFSFDNFERKLSLPNVVIINKILPLRNIKKIESLVPISREMLLHLVKRIKTLDGKLPFQNSSIKMVKIDPRHLKIGQKFVYRENYQKLLEEVPDIFNQFMVSTGGLTDLGAYFVFGEDDSNPGLYSMACYVPPLIEKHGPDLVIMDGIHRDYIAKQSGATLNAVIIENVDVPFPCGARDWSEIKIISLSEKPKNITERYFDLNQHWFRDLKYLGIDG